MADKISLDDVADEQSAERYFIQQRWRDGIACAWCGAGSVSVAKPSNGRLAWRCSSCRKTFGVASNCSLNAIDEPLLMLARAIQASRDELGSRGLAASAQINQSRATRMLNHVWGHLLKESAIFDDAIRWPTEEQMSPVWSKVFARNTPLRLHRSVNGGPSLWRAAPGEKAADVKYDLRGAMLTVSELSVVSGRNESAIRAALRGGRSAEDACFGRIVTYEPGDKFGLLTVVSRASPKGGRYRVCKCAGCGTMKDVATDKLKNGEAKTCGRKGCRGKGAGHERHQERTSGHDLQTWGLRRPDSGQDGDRCGV